MKSQSAQAGFEAKEREALEKETGPSSGGLSLSGPQQN